MMQVLSFVDIFLASLDFLFRIASDETWNTAAISVTFQ